MEWIPCSDRLPKKYESVIVCFKSGVTGEGYLTSNKNEWRDCLRGTYVDFNLVTHWIPLPKPPKK